MELAEGGIDNIFLAAFAKPVHNSACECSSRDNEPSLTQVMQLINNGVVLAKLKSPTGLIDRLVADAKTTPELIELIYLATLSRRPSAAEMELVDRHLSQVGDRTAGASRFCSTR